MAVLYWKPCYNEARYNEVGLYLCYYIWHSLLSYSHKVREMLSGV